MKRESISCGDFFSWETQTGWSQLIFPVQSFPFDTLSPLLSRALRASSIISFFSGDGEITQPRQFPTFSSHRHVAGRGPVGAGHALHHCGEGEAAAGVGGGGPAVHQEALAVLLVVIGVAVGLERVGIFLKKNDNNHLTQM